MRLLLGAAAGGGVGALAGFVYALAVVGLQEQYIQQGLTWLALEKLLDLTLRALLAGACVGGLTSLPLLFAARRDPAPGEDAGHPARSPALVWTSIALALASSAAAVVWLASSHILWESYRAAHSALEIAIDVGALSMLAGLLGSAIGWIVRRTLRATRTILPVGSLALVVWLAPMWGPQPTGPNLLLISVDTLRADRLSSYGYTAGDTVHIEALARSGAVWEMAIASAPVTLVATATLMTGFDPMDHGVRYNGFYRLDRRHTTLAEILANKGYRTGAVIGNFALDHSFLIDQGFETYDDLMTQRMSPPEAFATRREKTGKRSDRRDWWRDFRRNYPAQRFADEITDAALAWLRANDGEPFFLWIHYMDPHKPYAAPSKFQHLKPYDAEVAYVDAEIGRFMAGMNAMQADAETLVVFVADHGESLREHGYVGHVEVLYQQTLHVPFIMSLPGRIPAGLRIARPISGREIRGEILRVLSGGDAAATHWMRPESSADSGWRAYSETFHQKIQQGHEPIRSITDGRWKYIYQQSGIEELYDLSIDESESQNLVSRVPERAASFRAELEAWDSEVAEAPAEIDDATREKLKALGYLE